MSALVLVSLALLASAPAATSAAMPLESTGIAASRAQTTAPPTGRDYAGPRAVAAPQATDTVVIVDPGSAPVATTARGPADRRGQPVAPHVPESPRLLATIDGEPADEVAVIGSGKLRFSPGIQVRNQIGWVSPFTLDRFANDYSDGGFSTGRIRWHPRLEIRDKLTVVGMVDLVNGRWAPTGSSDPVVDRIIADGQPPGRASVPAVADPRELYLEYRFSLGLVRVGQQAFTWGQGMLANSGNYVDRFGDMRFGDDSLGDIYERVLLATKPFAHRAGPIRDLVLAIGGDLVYRDERARLTAGDLAGQALLVVRWQPEDNPTTWLGGYLVYRNEQDADDGDAYDDDTALEVGVADIAGQGTLWLRDDLQLMGAFESAIVFGRTSVARDMGGAHKVVQGGAVARGYLGDHDTWLVGFDAGYASGDSNPDDRFITNFVFDAGHTAGLVLFNQVLGWRTAQTEILATNGELSGVPLNGTQYIPTRGGVSNAIYIHPKVRYALWERLELWGGPLIAAAPAPIIDPYVTRLAGGVPTNSVGGDGNRRYYGTELDLGIRARFDIRDFWLQAGLQGGVLLPGAGLANAAGDSGNVVGALWFRTEIRY